MLLKNILATLYPGYEEGSAEEQLEARHGGRAERDGHHLEGGREGGPEPCPMEDCR